MSPSWSFLLVDVLSFGVKALVVAVVFAAVAVLVAGSFRRDRSRSERLEIQGMNERYRDLADAILFRTLGDKPMKKQLKARKKAEKRDDRKRSTAFVLDYHGNMMASATESLREELSAVLGAATEGDEVVVRLESPGGVVPGYGLAASQLQRVRARGLRLVVCIDKVAASGGYMMACVADEILAAPFAVVGSIGVAAPTPNIHRLLRDHGIDYEDVTAGEYKRTVSLMGEVTEAGRQKYQEQLDEVHSLFKGFVRENRSGLDVDRVSTGEYWHGIRALELGLVDRLLTSDDYLIGLAEDMRVLKVTFHSAHGVVQRIGQMTSAMISRISPSVL